MPVIRLKLPADWSASIEALAVQRGQSVHDLITDSLAFFCPRPTRKKKWFDDEAAAQHAANICAVLQSAHTEIVSALKRLEPPPKTIRNQALHVARRKVGHRLKNAMATKGLRQIDVASVLGVNRRIISAVICGRISLPQAWLNDLNQLLGDDWMNE